MLYLGYHKFIVILFSNFVLPEPRIFLILVLEWVRSFLSNLLIFLNPCQLNNINEWHNNVKNSKNIFPLWFIHLFSSCCIRYVLNGWLIVNNCSKFIQILINWRILLKHQFNLNLLLLDITFHTFLYSELLYYLCFNMIYFHRLN